MTKDLPNPMPDPKPAPGKDLPDPMPDHPKAMADRDIPAPLKDDKAGQTAIDERGGKAIRGWENIDQKGHDQSNGDAPEDRDGTNGH